MKRTLKNRIWAAVLLLVLCLACPAYADDTFYSELTLTIPEKGLHIPDIDPVTYTGSALTPTLQVKDGSTLLTRGTDYTVKYKNNTAANYMDEEGNWLDHSKLPTATVTFRGRYSGSLIAVFQILPRSIAECEISDLTVYYTGKDLKLKPTVKWSGKALSTSCYTWRILQNGTAVSAAREVGDYQLEFTGKGNFSGTTICQLHVVPDDRKPGKKLVDAVKNLLNLLSGR